MTPGALLSKARARAQNQAERVLAAVDAVFDDDIWPILDQYGLLARLDAGELTCYFTGVLLTRDNLGGLIGTAAGPRLIADTYEWNEKIGR